MIRTELVGLGLAVSLIIVVVVIATSDISSLYNPDYLGAVPGTLSQLIRNGAFKVTEYVQLHKATWIALAKQYEWILAVIIILVALWYRRRRTRRTMAEDPLERLAVTMNTLAETVTKVVALREGSDEAFKVTQKVDPAQLTCANARVFYEEMRVLEDQWYASHVSTAVKKYK